MKRGSATITLLLKVIYILLPTKLKNVKKAILQNGRKCLFRILMREMVSVVIYIPRVHSLCRVLRFFLLFYFWNIVEWRSLYEEKIFLELNLLFWFSERCTPSAFRYVVFLR